MNENPYASPSEPAQPLRMQFNFRRRTSRMVYLQRGLLCLWASIFGCGVLSLNLKRSAAARIPHEHASLLAQVLGDGSPTESLIAAAGFGLILLGLAGFAVYLFRALRRAVS